jgi:LacI family transcriptional regulator
MVNQQPSTRTRSTLRMVAERAGVSTATVSYVLSGRNGGRTGVSTATIDRVRKAAAELDYQPNQAARTIRTGRTDMILLSLTMLSDPWAQAMSEAVSAAAMPAGLTPLILADGDWPNVLARQPADAAFIDALGNGEDKPAALRRLARRGSQLIVFDDELEPEGFDVIRSVDTPGCRLAVRHLLAGHDRIACLTSRSPDGRPRRRHRVFLEEMEAAGREVRETDVEYFEGDAATAFGAATRLLSQPKPPDAIYTVTDFAAIQAIQAAFRLRLRVPEDVAIIGVGNTMESERTTPTLSSVGPTDFFSTVSKIIIDRATGTKTGPPELHEFSWSLFDRESTRRES